MKKPNELAKLNKNDFLKTFAELYEHSIWVVENAFDEVKNEEKYNDINVFHSLLADIVLNASKELQDSLIKAHPMLAGKKAMQNELTEFSTNEQKSAGLNSCSQDEIETFNTLNKIYFEKFAFPFIMAVKGKTKEEILKNFKIRIENSFEVERETALAEINKIGLIRIRGIYE
jgi:OHCU decarboxylase